MQGLDVKKFEDLKDVFKLMVDEMPETGLEGEFELQLVKKNQTTLTGV